MQLPASSVDLLPPSSSSSTSTLDTHQPLCSITSFHLDSLLIDIRKLSPALSITISLAMTSADDESFITNLNLLIVTSHQHSPLYNLFSNTFQNGIYTSCPSYSYLASASSNPIYTSDHYTHRSTNTNGNFVTTGKSSSRPLRRWQARPRGAQTSRLHRERARSPKMDRGARPHSRHHLRQGP